MQVTVSVIAMYMTVSSKNFIFLSLTTTFHKIDPKTFNPILVGGGGGGGLKITPQEKNVKNVKNRQATGLPGRITKQNLVFDVS